MLKKTNRYVVTGASGFVGRAVVEDLRVAGCEVVGVGRQCPSDWGSKFVTAVPRVEVF